MLLITAAGGVFYAWIIRQWGWSLWPAIFLHALMNLPWLIFGIADNAAGGLVPNIGRAGTIAIVLTLRRAKPNTNEEPAGPRSE